MKHAISTAIISLSAIHSSFAADLKGAGNYLFQDQQGRTIPVYYYVPDQAPENQVVVIVLHGLKRNAQDYRDSWISAAKEHGLTILAPLFSRDDFRGANGYHLGHVFDAQTDDEIKGKTKPTQSVPQAEWSFAIPDQVFKDFVRRSPRKEQGYTLYGHGAGAQFAHRYALFQPDSLACTIIAANSGWYTFPAKDIPWPYGLQGVDRLDEAAIDKALGSKLWLFVGEEDQARTGVLRVTEQADAQGKNRLTRAENFFQYGQALAQQREINYGWQLIKVTNAKHRNQEMQTAVASRIQACSIEH